MEDTSPATIGDLLRQFATKITTSSVKERQTILGNILPCVRSGDFPENAMKGVLKHLMMTLTRYRDRKSRRAVEELLDVLATYHFTSMSSVLVSFLMDVADQLNKARPSTDNSGMALSALSWCSLTVRAGYKKSTDMQGDAFTKLVNTQSVLLCAALAAQNKIIGIAAYKRVRRLWMEVAGSAQQYASVLATLESGGQHMCMVGCLMKYLSSRKQSDILDKYKDVFLKQYVSQVVGSRGKPAAHILKSCKELLRHATHEFFKEVILPATERALLRNPEIILEVISELLAGVSIDISPYAMQVGKHLASQCHSQDESTRQVALAGCRHLAHQCSDAAPIETLAQHFFSVLNGCEGKLSVVEQRMGMMSGVGSLSQNAVSGSTVQSMAAAVAQMFIPILQQEVHEATLIHMLAMFSLWCSKFTTDVPTKVLLWLKTGIGQKSSTSAVRNAYIHVFLKTFSGDTLQQGVGLLEMMLQTVERARAQPSQHALVCEAVTATLLLLNVSVADIQAEQKITPLWNTLLDKKKPLFVNDKFLASTTNSAIQTLCTVVEKLVLEHSQKLDEAQSSLYCRALVFALTHGARDVRVHAQSVARKLLAALGGAQIGLALIREFTELLDRQKVKLTDGGAEGQENGEVGEGGVVGGVIAPRVLADTLTLLARVPATDPAVTVALAVAALAPAQHPHIVAYDADLWTDIVASLHLDAAQLLRSNLDDILSQIRNSPVISQQTANLVRLLVRVTPDPAVNGVIEYVDQLLDNAAFLTVTVNEVEVMRYTGGGLYNKAVVNNLSQEESSANLKRENKLYSYAEQMADLELKKEMEKKRTGALGGEPVRKLSKRQQEMEQSELKREADIRSRLQTLEQHLENACALIEACGEGNATQTRLQLPTILGMLVALIGSPLAAPRVSTCLVRLGRCALADQDGNFRDLLCHTALRLLQPACPLPAAWTSEPADVQSARAVALLYAVTARRPLPAPAFAYIFPLLRAVLEGGEEEEAEDDGTEGAGDLALKVVDAHTRLRADTTKTGVDECGPALLPRVAILRLLLGLVSGGGRLQSAAVSSLLATARCAAGVEAGSAVAGQPELDVLLAGLLSAKTLTREAALQAIQVLVNVLPTPKSDRENALTLSRRIWVATFDAEADIKKLAESVWAEAGLVLSTDVCSRLVQDDLMHVNAAIRQAAACALAAAVHRHPNYVTSVLQQLLDVYEQKLYLPPPVFDNFGREVSSGVTDAWPARCGIALALAQLAPAYRPAQVTQLFDFYVAKGLNDRSAEVSQQMLTAALAALNHHGKDNVGVLLPLFEKFLRDAPATASYDTVRQCVVILMGSLAKHLDKDDDKVKPIVAKLIETLSTPSHQVQAAVAACLPALVPAIRDSAPTLAAQLLDLLLNAESYGERRGAAHGLAGLVRGLGILALKQLDIMPTLTEAVQDRRSVQRREGALLAFEQLCLSLGRLFEPYVVHILPHLLVCFGDTNQYVRQAADETAKAVMSQLSAHGVKLVLPSLLSALEEDSWRTKTGSVELLGAMAFCAPKQLSACLPSIVPKLSEVLTDSHLKVQKAGAQALKQIGSVIRNPEIQAIVPTLLAALQDPAGKTTVSLQRLLSTHFIHFIDAPSLALIMPVVQRAFQNRSTETRKMAAQIIGNMYSLTDQKDLAPYLPQVIPGLKQSLLDPVPEVRTVSARALGAIVRGMGESGFEQLVPWLMQMLTAETSSVDRSGAAQGLSEVVGALGVDKLHKLMPDIMQTAERTDIQPHVRDGYIMMYIYLPAVFGDEFICYVAPIIPSILQALADECEFVRDTALRAGQRIVQLYADTAVELLLPQLERGLFDDNWRIRYSSIQLLGDLLFRISGVSGKMSTESAGDDDNFGTETCQRALLDVLGAERRDRVLAGLYMGRSDTVLAVRQAALHVWKVVVSHTPKTLRDILATLFQLLLGCLASSSYDKRQGAARTLGDIVRKLGEKVLPEIIPILELGLESEHSVQRQGVCIGLSEIMRSTSRDHVAVFADSLIPAVSRALIDPLPAVRASAALTFDNLHTNIGVRALDDILPSLLKNLDDPELSEYALDGLKQVMIAKGRVVLPYLVPQLTSTPVNTRALSFLASVAGDALFKHLHRILPALMGALGDSMGDPEREEQELSHCTAVVLAVSDDAGVRLLLDELVGAVSAPRAPLRYAAVRLLSVLCTNSRIDLTEHIPGLLRVSVRCMADDEPRVLAAAWDCLSAIVKQLDAAEMLGHIGNVRQAIRFTVADFKGEHLPGFCLPKKGIAPILPIFREGLLNGPPELKESAAVGLGELIHWTSPEALRPSVVQMTGPLIRVLGDRFSFSVKVAVLDTLALLLAKCSTMLKPFLPQLQTTFVKALNDPNRAVRLRAAAALSRLVGMQARVDPLFTELHAGVKNADDPAVTETMLHTLRGCVIAAGAKMSGAICRDIQATLESLCLQPGAAACRQTAAACLGALCAWMTEDDLSILLNMHLLDSDATVDWEVRLGRALVLSVALKEAADRLAAPEWRDRVVDAVVVYGKADRLPICLSGLRGIGYLMAHSVASEQPVSPVLTAALSKTMKHDSSDVKQLSARVVSYVAAGVDRPLDLALIRPLIPMLVNGTKEKNTGVRYSNEAAIITLLRLRQRDGTAKACLNILDDGMRESLSDVMTKIRKSLTEPDTGRVEIDDTLLV